MSPGPGLTDFRKGIGDRLPYLIYSDFFHADIILTLICELFTRAAGNIVADGLVQGTERLKSDVIAGPK